MSKSVLTLLAPPDKEKLKETFVAKVSASLAREGALVMATDWLAEGIACDVVFTRLEPELAEEITRGVIGSEAIDCIAQSSADRQKRMLISDMDSTIITIECIDEIADFAGVKTQVAGITERAMRGELDFKEALAERVALLAGLKESTLQQVYNERVQFMPGAKALVKTMRAHGAYCVLVSGGFGFFTSRVREELGFHSDASNTLEIQDGKLTGRVVPPILDKNSKLQTLMQVCAERQISTGEVLAIGDGANDLPMLVAAGLGVAYHAKPVVKASARARLDHCDLSALLYAQGYRAEEIME